MKRRFVPRLPARIWLAACWLLLLCLPGAGSGSSARADNVEFCGVMDHEAWLREHAVGAGKRAAELIAGEPRTVRMFYFLPNDRPFRQEMVDSMKTTMRRLQAFFGQQMAAHGYGPMTFRYEADAAGAPVVRRVDGDHGDAYYLEETSIKMQRELYRRFDVKNVVDFIVVDTSTGLLHEPGGQRYAGMASGGKDGGQAKVGGGFSFFVAAHELAHAFGLMWHDFRDDTYILSYGFGLRTRLSACSARYLAVTPLLNPEIPLGIDRTSAPTIEFAGPTVWYAPGTERFTVSWRVADPDGVHQVIQWTGHPLSRSLTPEVKACRDVAGETEAVVSFEYDGAIPSMAHSSLSNPTSHQLPAKTVDTQGNGSSEGLIIAQASPHHVATLTVETKFIYGIAISPLGDLLAAGTQDSYTLSMRGQAGYVRLWDLARREEVASLLGDAQYVKSVAFSPDGGLLASAGVTDDTVKLWDVARREEVAVLEGHTGTINSVAFSPDGSLLASAGFDSTVRVWDVARREEVAVLEGHTGIINSVAFSPAAGVLASAGYDRTIRVWDLAARREVAVLEGHTGTIESVAFSPDGSLLAAGGGGSAEPSGCGTRRRGTRLPCSQGRARTAVRTWRFLPSAGNWQSYRKLERSNCGTCSAKKSWRSITIQAGTVLLRFLPTAARCSGPCSGAASNCGTRHRTPALDPGSRTGTATGRWVLATS